MGCISRRVVIILLCLFAATSYFSGLRAASDGVSVSDKAQLRKVVLDSGHGGKDPGCVSGSVYEKDITLALAKKLGKLIESNFPETEVIYTRSKDVYVELAERGKIANRAGADLFISIHINASTNSAARGTSTHIMGMDKSGKNLEVTMRENDVVIYEDDYTTKYEGYNPGDPASFIMFSLMQYAHQDQSMMFAQIVQKHFKSNLPMPDRGTTQEPFLVLWRASMPSVLVEVGFISNQTDRTYISSDKGQNEAARSLFNAFSEYKSKVEGRANVVMLREQTAAPKPEQPKADTPQNAAKPQVKAKSSDNAVQDSASAAKTTDAAPRTRLVGQEPYEGVLFYVQLMVTSRKQPNDPCFKSYKNKVCEKKASGNSYRYMVGGVKSYDEIVALQRGVRKEFAEAFVVAYEGDKQIDVTAARRKAVQ